MCGIAGVISKNKSLLSNYVLKAMIDIIAHRGPNGEGHWISPNGKVGFGHRRLSIIDLSHGADQPMHYLDRYTIVFNGEIYNYIELKETLLKQGYQFKTQSDTEVLMALYDRDKENCLQLLDGMFSFVIYDEKENIAFCARDRFGEKPFFYSYKQGEYFYFGSEMKCLWAAGIKKEVNNKMLYNFMSFGYLENPQDLSETFFNNCTRLKPGHYIVLNLYTGVKKIEKYYNVNWKHTDLYLSNNDVKDKLHNLLYTSINRRLRSDVAVGSSLSGGLDSSLIVCIVDDLLKNTNNKSNTFSAVFPGFKKDESKYIEQVVAKTNVTPHFVTPSENDLINDLEKLSWHQEEPFCSASIYAQYSVMKTAKKNNTTVLLDGQGADEIFAGYMQYYLSFFKELKTQNKSELHAQHKAYLDLHKNNAINGIVKKSVGDRIRQVSPRLVKQIKKFTNNWSQLSNPVFNKDFFNQYKNEIFETPGSNFNTLNEALHNSIAVKGLHELLRYADRNSMAHGIEVRLPFLYHELVEFMFALPANFKINQGWTKWILRDTFNILPTDIRWRIDKIAYEPPQSIWMQNKHIKELINSNCHNLIKNKILNKNVLQSNLSENKNWIYLQAGQLI